jgi:hypothetical protein
VADKANADLYFMDEAPDGLPQPSSSASKKKKEQQPGITPCAPAGIALTM